VVSHGKKLSKFGLSHRRIEVAVELSDLSSLVGCSYEMVDKGLLSAFVERWHPGTNSFHLPIREMTITLDDVSTLLHLPVIGRFYTYPTLDAETTTDLLVEVLNVDRSNAGTETRQCRGGHVRFSWLREVYEDACSNKQWTIVARAYLLHLVGGTISADKSASSVNVSLMGFFVDLRVTGEFSWAAAALTYLYEQFGDASYGSTKQLSGYATLLQISCFIV